MKALQEKGLLISEILPKGEEFKFLLDTHLNTFDEIHEKKIKHIERHVFVLHNQVNGARIVCSENTNIREFDLKIQNQIIYLKVTTFWRKDPITNPKRAG